jgi:hypothetical protein
MLLGRTPLSEIGNEFEALEDDDQIDEQFETNSIY